MFYKSKLANCDNHSSYSGFQDLAESASLASASVSCFFDDSCLYSVRWPDYAKEKLASWI